MEIDEIRPTPTPAEVAAILAAVEALWPRPAAPAAAEAPSSAPTWRFSGRWWRKPVAARRERPW